MIRYKVMDTSFSHIIGLPDVEDDFLGLLISLLLLWMGAARRARRRKVEAEKGMAHSAVTLVVLPPLCPTLHALTLDID